MSHTATPWKANGFMIEEVAHPYQANGRPIAHTGGNRSIEEDRDNAAFIALACNCHEELLTACNGIAAKDFTDAYEVLDFGPGGTSDEFKAQELIDERMAAVRAAIARAEGKPDGGDT